jgi:GDSL-like lipase/acylhydrolase family protein
MEERRGCRVTRRIAAVAVAALVLATAAPASAGHRAVGKRLFVVGDSLAVGTKPYLPRLLHGWRIRSSVSISKHAPEGAAELARRGHSLPPVVVASLGTNDDPHATGSFEAAVRKSLRAAGKHGCIVWPNIVRPSVGGATYAGYNNVLDRIAKRNDRLRVVDWAAMAAHNRGWFGDDGVHPNATGYLARARAIAKQVRRCRRSLIE